MLAELDHLWYTFDTASVHVDRGESDLMQVTAMEIHLWPVYVARHSPDETPHFLSVLS